jgi:hypothetical protein
MRRKNESDPIEIFCITDNGITGTQKFPPNHTKLLVNQSPNIPDIRNHPRSQTPQNSIERGTAEI